MTGFASFTAWGLRTCLLAAAAAGPVGHIHACTCVDGFAGRAGPEVALMVCTAACKSLLSDCLQVCM